MTYDNWKSEGSELTKIAADCHRSKWQFDDSERTIPAAEARRLVRRAFDELHRIGDAAMKARDALKTSNCT